MSLEIDFPWSIGPRGGTAETTYIEHVRDMIEQVLFTVPGERVERPEFGCLLADMVFEPNSPERAAAVQSSALGALERWLGDEIAVNAVTATATDSTLEVVVAYRLLDTNAERTDTFTLETT